MPIYVGEMHRLVNAAERFILLYELNAIYALRQRLYDSNQELIRQEADRLGAFESEIHGRLWPQPGQGQATR